MIFQLRKMKRTLHRRLGYVVLGMALSVLLAGCKNLTGEGVDHAVSRLVGKECGPSQANVGGLMCTDSKNTAPRNEVYYYRPLGRVTCYDRPLVGINDQPFAIPATAP
ncbi:MAG: hypothetical protein FD149_1584 [Rhodospirillaceae bacterium]|nr:MAG: hypothetical protein FD149_1584 [Rhodospirillaceae bacterium]